MKTIQQIAFILLFSNINCFAQLPPIVYKNMIKNSSEIVTIKIEDIKIENTNCIKKKVFITARLISVKKTNSNLKDCDTIQITYNYQESYPKDWVGPKIIPLLEKNKIYRAYLKHIKQNIYKPSAKGESFKLYIL